MKSIILVALALAAVAVAAPTEKQAEILSAFYEQQADGSFLYKFATDDGITREETGDVREVVDEENKVQKVIVFRGSYSYPGEDGKPIIIQYVADESGFHPEGDSIPKNPAPARR
nr:larval cuticle protein 1-like [Helicoverpa armigera]